VVSQVRSRFKASACLYVIGAFLVLWTLPAVDLPETNFDEANTPTNEMVERYACLGCMASLKAVVPRILAGTPDTRLSDTPSVRPAEIAVLTLLSGVALYASPFALSPSIYVTKSQTRRFLCRQARVAGRYVFHVEKKGDFT
jgi:hypothetical protein